MKLKIKLFLIFTYLFLWNTNIDADTDIYYFTLGGDNDSKSYTKQVNYTGNISVTLENIPEGCNYDLELLDAGFNEVASSRNPGNLDESISYSVSPSGTETYYIIVKSSYGGSSSECKLTITYPYDTTNPTIEVWQSQYPTTGWYKSDPGNVIDVDFVDVDEEGNYESGLDYAQYKIGSDGAWINIFTTDCYSYTTNWGVPWSSLSEGSNTIYIRVYDKVGLSASDSITFKKDTQPPTTPSNLNITDPGTGVELNLTWNSSTDTGSGVKHYKVEWATDSEFTQNKQEDTTTNNYYTAKGLITGVRYYFRVQAEDNAGNRSYYSDTKKGIPNDTTQPVVTILEPVIDGDNIDPGEEVTFNYSISDGNVMKVEWEVKNIRSGIPISSATLTGQSTGDYSFTVKIPNDENNLVYDQIRVKISAQDPYNEKVEVESYYYLGFDPPILWLRWPMDWEHTQINSVFGDPRPVADGIPTRFHTGIDIDGSKGTKIYAADKGYIRSDGDIGNDFVILSHEGVFDTKTAYIHIQNKQLSVPGQVIYKGDILAETDSKNHLHYEVKEGDVYINPLIYCFQDDKHFDDGYPYFKKIKIYDQNDARVQEINLIEDAGIYKPNSAISPVEGNVKFTVLARDSQNQWITNTYGIYSANYLIDGQEMYRIEFKTIAKSDKTTKQDIIYGYVKMTGSASERYHEYKLYGDASLLSSGSDLISGWNNGIWDTTEVLDGVYTLTVNISDVDNHQATAELEIIVDNDKTPEITTMTITSAGIELNKDENERYWIPLGVSEIEVGTSEQMEELNFEVEAKGILESLYRDITDRIKYTGSLIIDGNTPNGLTKIIITGKDMAGNPASGEYYVVIDTIPVATTELPQEGTAGVVSQVISISTKAVEVKAWYSPETEFCLENDFIGLTDKDRIYYKTETDVDYLLYTQPLTFSSGTHRISYYAIDFAGNKSREIEMEINVDGTPPDVKIIVEGKIDKGYVYEDYYYRITATDNESGVKEIKVKIDDGDWVSYEADEVREQFLLGLSSGVHHIYFYAIDNVGNESNISTYPAVLPHPLMVFLEAERRRRGLQEV